MAAALSRYGKLYHFWGDQNVNVPQKILSKILDPEYYNKEVKQLKVKVRKMYNKRKFEHPYQADLKWLSTELLVAKKKAQKTFLRSVFQNKGRCWKEF